MLFCDMQNRRKNKVRNSPFYAAFGKTFQAISFELSSVVLTVLTTNWERVQI